MSIPHPAGLFRARRWSVQDFETIRTLVAEGKSAAQICPEFQCSRSAVIAFCHRNGLKLHGKRDVHAAADKFRQTMRANKPARDARAASSPRPDYGTEEVAPLGIPFQDLTGAQCRWPMGPPLEKSEFFCGSDKMLGKPYCKGHCRMAYLPPSERRA